MNATSVYDTIIIGGGPVGSTAGAFLGKAGQRVIGAGARDVSAISHWGIVTPLW